VTPDDPEALRNTVSLGMIIARTRDVPIHIVYVHGMRADGVGASDSFRAALVARVPGLQAGAPDTQYLDLGPARPPAMYLNDPLWRDDNEWKASRPFVIRYVYSRRDASAIVVDEVNWWPLLFPPKCRFIALPETDLSGVDESHIRLCGRSDGHYFPWLSKDEVNSALAHRPKSGGGARINASIKQQIMNWGVADAALALGPLRSYFRQAINQALGFASAYDGKGVDGQEFVVIAESLGSFVVLDAFGDLFNDSPDARQVGEQTADLYFFANQFALLELGRISGIPEGATDAVRPSPLELLLQWASSGKITETTGRLKQVIAFSDPSDLLTYRVPKLRRNGTDVAIVVNVYDQNETKWLGVFADPLSAHTGHSKNKDVLDLIFRT
jgi:hypothetical protein